jgi:hypothetical protein
MTSHQVTSSLKASRSGTHVLRYGVIVLAVWLAWEVIKVPVVQRATPSIALRLSPGSPEALRRAAEVEFKAERTENALALATDSLRRAPFNARALRAWAQSEDAIGDKALANEAMTLAGNWSLRDDEAHAWLMVQRLRQGDLLSAFAHADTLARRRPDLSDQLFALFNEAVTRDSRGAAPLASIMSASPPWRGDFLNYLNRQPNGAVSLGYIALALEKTRQPLTTAELSEVYAVWVRDGRLDGLKQLRDGLGRPKAERAPQDGSFDAPAGSLPFPFGWRIALAANFDGSVMPDDARADNQALRVSYNGFTTGILVDQMMYLAPGRYTFAYDVRGETPDNGRSLSWAVICAESGVDLAATPQAPEITADWQRRRVNLEVPPGQCSSQWLRLQGEPDDGRQQTAIWYDNIVISPTLRAGR